MDFNIQQFVHSEYIVYVDESGSPDLKNVDPKYPVFVLTFCVIKKNTYIYRIVPKFQKMKFLFFGHDNVEFHAYEIRQKENHFAFLHNSKAKEKFFSELNNLMSESRFVVISTVIKKADYKKGKRDIYKRDIYHESLQFCMERLNDFLIATNQHRRETHIICEARGKKEDRILKGEFNKILQNRYDFHSMHRRPYNETPMKIEFARKGPTGLQIADMIGHPIGRHVINPKQKNRVFEIIKRKIFTKRKQRIGLKIFP